MSYPSSHIIAIVMSRVGVTRFHGIGTNDVSVSHGSWSRTALWNSSRSSMDELASGPITAWIDSCPTAAALLPAMGIRIAVGLKPYAPQNAAGTRIEPPMSEPMPSGEHRKPAAAPSPPDEPPGVKVRLYGFRVFPVMLFSQHRC